MVALVYSVKHFLSPFLSFFPYWKSWKKYYECINKLGQGGNGTVYKVKNKNSGEEVAIKVFKNVKKDSRRYKRIINEISFLQQHKGIKGVIPILNYDKRDLWYTMPIAEPAFNAEHPLLPDVKAYTRYIVDEFIFLGEVLCQFHHKGISHRDIKPANLLIYGNHFNFCDFGLVHLPNPDKRITAKEKAVGAIFTMAPEMRRNPGSADGCAADVYSLAKTLWMFLTLNEKGFDGSYDTLNTAHSLRFHQLHKKHHIAEIEQLLTQATQDTPECRPTIDAFIIALQQWKENEKDYQIAQREEWRYLKNLFIGLSDAETSIWRKKDKILDVLNIISNSIVESHVLFPEYGGLDFMEAKSYFRDCIELHYGHFYPEIIYPKRLIYENFSQNQEWNYFVLEASSMQPILGEEDDSYTETLLEDTPGHFVSARDAIYGVYDYDIGNPLPKNARKIIRRLKGKLLIAFKYGKYNKSQLAYTGIQNSFSIDELRLFFAKFIQEESKYRDAKGKKVYESSDSPVPCHEDLFDGIDFLSWKFSKKEDSGLNGKLQYYFEFRPSACRCLGDTRKFVLGKDGHIKELCSLDKDALFLVKSPEIAMQNFHHLNKCIRCFAEEEGKVACDIGMEFRLKSIMLKPPTHFFSKEELRTEMIKADDRVRNLLVIDEDGYVKIIPYPVPVPPLQPVTIRIFPPRECLLGKYSALPTFENDYNLALQHWLYYLEHGQETTNKYPYGNLSLLELITCVELYYRHSI